MKKALVRSMVVLFLFAANSHVHASFISDLTGNSIFGGGSGSIRSYVNFAVFDATTTGDWRTSLGVTSTTLAGTIDGAAKTICLYQITRNTAALDSNVVLNTFTLPTNLHGNTTWRGAGILSGTVFSSGGAVVGATPGPLNTMGAPATAGTPTTGIAAPTFVADGTAIDPTFLGTLTAFPTFNFAGGGGIAGGGESAVLVMTSMSTISPDWGFRVVGGTATGSLSGGVPADSATAPIPVSNPEPCSLVLLGLGMIGGGAGVLWKRRKKKPSSVA